MSTRTKTRKKIARRQRRQHVALPDPLPPCLTRRETCAFARLSYPTIVKLMNRGEFPQPHNAAPDGKAFRWKSAELMAWLDGRERRAAPQPQPSR